MRYIQRDAHGEFLGHFANRQPGVAEEAVADDHPDIVAWATRRAAVARGAVNPITAMERRMAALERAVAELQARG